MKKFRNEFVCTCCKHAELNVYSNCIQQNSDDLNWQKVENFYNRSLKCIFDLPSYMSSLRARQLFKSQSFREQIEDRAVGRIGDIITSTGFISNTVYTHEFFEGRDTVLDRAYKVMGIEGNLDCNFCPFGAVHDCVEKQISFV